MIQTAIVAAQDKPIMSLVLSFRSGGSGGSGGPLHKHLTLPLKP